MKKFLTIALALALILSLAIPASAALTNKNQISSPDLEVVSITTDHRDYAGNDVVVATVVVRNNSTTTKSRLASLSVSCAHGSNSVMVNVLNPGEQVAKVVKVSVSNTSGSGLKTPITATIDPTNYYKESNEANNSKSVLISVSRFASSAPVPSIPSFGSLTDSGNIILPEPLPAPTPAPTPAPITARKAAR